MECWAAGEHSCLRKHNSNEQNRRNYLIRNDLVFPLNEKSTVLDQREEHETFEQDR